MARLPLLQRLQYYKRMKQQQSNLLVNCFLFTADKIAVTYI